MEILVPTCALIKHRGTVIVRLRDMDVCKGCPKPEAYRFCEQNQPLDYSICEQCTRTTFYSDCCDSAYHERWRPYRARAAKSRYVNVCAAVCLLLLVSGFPPQSAAAPHRSTRDTKKMDRERRSNSEREFFWENPCDYNESGARSSVEYTPEDAKKAALDAKRAYDGAAEYKDEFALTTHGYQSYQELLGMWETYKWLRELPWYREEVLPAEQTFGNSVSDEFVTNLVTNNAKFEEVLPVMFKTLKLVVAALDAMERDGLSARKGDFSPELSKKISDTKFLVRNVLCDFSDIMSARKLPQDDLKLVAADIPDFKEGQLDRMLLVYRDSLDYLAYLSQVFQKMSDKEV